MYIHQIVQEDDHVASEPTLKCACSALRKAVRAVDRIYEVRLARANVTATQFTILRALQRHGMPVPLTALAEELVLERTSLYRAMEPLAGQKLIAFGGAKDKRVKQARLTAAGVGRIDEALPHWKEAQDIFSIALGGAHGSVGKPNSRRSSMPRAPFRNDGYTTGPRKNSSPRNGFRVVLPIIQGKNTTETGDRPEAPHRPIERTTVSCA